MVPSGTRVYLWNFNCGPSEESLIKQMVEDAAERYKLGRIFHEKLFHFPLATQSEDLY